MGSRNHRHEWIPEDDGYYYCYDCGDSKLIPVEDAIALWGNEDEAAEDGKDEM